ncbi:HD domain-containing protein [Kribbella sp. VKM Ac-2527]|uniref:HD domain-containing protein n=1 Tax=Kribbella caucasensis TaxID=2512215 RepID=A0A4R6KPM4_9ACTN|nr:HD-GYP domain-containing protein [Kribbella sp. VKM Ac-2527]TDO52270.1 HD domain-containing protein [Kribbella sp. VKM Ac-2527]
MNSRWPLRLTVAFSAGIATVALFVALFHTRPDAPTLTLGLLLLVGALLRSKVGPVRASLDYVVGIALFLLSGVAAAVVVSVLLPLTQDRRLPLMRRVFNGAMAVLCASAAGLVFLRAGGVQGKEVLESPGRAMFAATMAIITWLAVSAVLMCLVLWLDRGATSPLDFLRKVAAPTVLPMMGYGLLGVLLAVVWIGGLGIGAAILVVVPLLVARWTLSLYEAERNAQAATMRAFIQVIETKDLYTRGHSERVSEGVGMLGRHLKLSENRQQALEHAGLLHDVGKVGVPTNIIRKPGRLDASEMDAIRLHPARGVELIGNIPFLEEVKSAVLHHHEKFDGSGYPAGLSGQNIPYFARIIGIVDAFDSLTSTRSYRPARDIEETLQILLQDRYTHFDPHLVDAFVEVIRARGWVTVTDQPEPDSTVQAAIDHDDLSLGSGGGATGSAAGPGA